MSLMQTYLKLKKHLLIDMYINFELMNKKGILMSELVTLIAINQKEAYLLKDIPFDSLEDDGLITFLKGPGSKEETVRLSKNGKALLDALTTRGASEELLELCQDLMDLYSFYGKEGGNILEVRDRLIWFIQATGFSPKVIKEEVESYLSKSEFILRLDNLIWKPQSSAFSVNFNLSDSRLFELIRNRFSLPVTFYLKPSDKRKVGESWLFNIMKLKVPRGLPPEQYWTGSEKTDKEALKRLQTQFRLL